jgi:uncharacterized protein YbbK (DUF523 family)
LLGKGGDALKKLLVSACLLGVCCRYDGKSKLQPGMEALAEKFALIPVCPEQLGGLPTPRTPSERRYGRVVARDGADVTEAFRHGADQACRIARLYGAKLALLKSRSPSCGHGEIYDGSFTGRRIPGNGVTAEALAAMGISLYDENDAAMLAQEPDA